MKLGKEYWVESHNLTTLFLCLIYAFFYWKTQRRKRYL